jgi:hypothetical protein
VNRAADRVFRQDFIGVAMGRRNEYEKAEIQRKYHKGELPSSSNGHMLYYHNRESRGKLSGLALTFSIQSAALPSSCS